MSQRVNLPEHKGVNLCERHSVWRQVVENGMQLAARCPCQNGCARCIHPPRYRASEAGALRKTDGLRFAESLLALAGGLSGEIFDPESFGWVKNDVSRKGRQTVDLPCHAAVASAPQKEVPSKKKAATRTPAKESKRKGYRDPSRQQVIRVKHGRKAETQRN